MNSLKSIRQGFFQQKETQSKNLSSQSLSANAEFFTQVSPPSVSTQAIFHLYLPLLMKH